MIENLSQNMKITQNSWCLGELNEDFQRRWLWNKQSFRIDSEEAVTGIGQRVPDVDKLSSGVAAWEIVWVLSRNEGIMDLFVGLTCCCTPAQWGHQGRFTKDAWGHGHGLQPIGGVATEGVSQDVGLARDPLHFKWIYHCFFPKMNQTWIANCCQVFWTNAD